MYYTCELSGGSHSQINEESSSISLAVSIRMSKIQSQCKNRLAVGEEEWIG